MTKDRVLAEALDLSEEDRREVADTLLASLAPPDERSEAQMRAAIEQRARRAVAGAPGLDWADARTVLEKRFGSF